jgi:hypothetical protein
LGEAERREFAAWLKWRQDQLKLSQTEMGKRLGGNPKQWRAYISHRVFPRSDGCLAIAKALEVPKPGLLFKAGYLSSLVGALPVLVRLGEEHCERDGFPFESAIGGSLVQRGIEPSGFLSYPINDKNYELLVPFQISDALYVAIAAFPRRGDWFNDDDDNYENDLWLRIENALDQVNYSYARSYELPFPLDLASQVLADGRIPSNIKKAVAGELTQFWANRVSLYASVSIRRHVYALFADKLGAVSPISGHGMPLSAVFRRIISGEPIIQPVNEGDKTRE